MRNLFAFVVCFMWFIADAPRSEAGDGRHIDIAVSENIKLAGRYFSPGEQGPGILLLNMCDPAKDQRAWWPLAAELSKRGFHVLTLDYRGFGESGGARPTNLDTVEKGMVYWRQHWLSDVKTAYGVLLNQSGVEAETMGIGGASCGVFMGLELVLDHPEIKTFVALGGPVGTEQLKRLPTRQDVPMLIISGDEGPVLEWSDELFNATHNRASRSTKYRIVTHGTNIFDHVPSIEGEVADWFVIHLK
jgi:predicted alpha/beta hydrolase